MHEDRLEREKYCVPKITPVSLEGLNVPSSFGGRRFGKGWNNVLRGIK